MTVLEMPGLPERTFLVTDVYELLVTVEDSDVDEEEELWETASRLANDLPRSLWSQVDREVSAV